jgi:5-methylcytosine-specific restriction endonuclease McrA
MDIVTDKYCAKCKLHKSLSSFNRNKTTKDGLQYRCRVCENEDVRKWRVANPDKAREIVSRWNEQNPKRRSENSIRWQKAHPERVREISRKFRQKHAEKRHESEKRWREANRERRRKNLLEWNRANPNKNAEYHAKRRARKTGNGGWFTAKEWRDLKEKYNNKCLCCGEEKPLSADHIIPISKGGTSNIDNIQPLCMSCNDSKGTKTIDYRPS